MLPNEQASGIRDLSKEPNRWDQTFYKTTIASLQRRELLDGVLEKTSASGPVRNRCVGAEGGESS